MAINFRGYGIECISSYEYNNEKHSETIPGKLVQFCLLRTRFLISGLDEKLALEIV